MGNWLYKIGVYRILYWVGRGVRWTSERMWNFGDTLMWLFLHREAGELLMKALDDLPKGLSGKVQRMKLAEMIAEMAG